MIVLASRWTLSYFSAENIFGNHGKKIYSCQYFQRKFLIVEILT